jgi:hypothetical protein
MPALPASLSEHHIHTHCCKHSGHRRNLYDGADLEAAVRTPEAQALADDIELLSLMQSNDAEAHAEFHARGGRR